MFDDDWFVMRPQKAIWATTVIRWTSSVKRAASMPMRCNGQT